MEIVEVIGVLLIAIVVASIFYYGLGRRGPWGAFWVFLLILFLAAWAGRLWLVPAGPVLWGYAWLPLIFWVFIIALLIGAASDNDRVSRRYDTTTARTDRDLAETEPEAGAAAALGLFFWILLSFLIIAILIGLLA